VFLYFVIVFGERLIIGHGSVKSDEFALQYITHNSVQVLRRLIIVLNYICRGGSRGSGPPCL